MDIKDEITKILRAALEEDVGNGDVTTESIIDPLAYGQYIIRAREKLVFCGLEVITQAFGTNARTLRIGDGDIVEAGQAIVEIDNNVQETLVLERTVLNLIQFLSGIATETAKYVEAVKGTKAKILDTRKTIPGLRALSKYAVKCGGGENHRMGLYDMVMIKDNHIKAAGGITAAVTKVRAANLKIEVECDSLEQIKEALSAGADVIMADNMSLENLKSAITIINGKVPLEASGNVNLQTVRAIAECGVDFISTSKVTMSARAVDIGLDEI